MKEEQRGGMWLQCQSSVDCVSAAVCGSTDGLPDLTDRAG